MTPKVAREGEPRTAGLQNRAAPGLPQFHEAGKNNSHPMSVGGFVGFLSTSHTSQRHRLRGQLGGIGSEEPPLPFPPSSHSTQVERAGWGLVPVGRLPLGWPLPMAPAENFEVVRKKKTKARKKGTQALPLLIASRDCPELDTRQACWARLPSPAAAFSTKCSSCQKLARSGYFSFTVRAMKCSSVIFLSVDLVSSSWERGTGVSARGLNTLAPQPLPHPASWPLAVPTILPDPGSGA